MPALAGRMGDVLQMRPQAAVRWVRRAGLAGWLEPLLVIALCGAVYGGAMGAWRAPLLALYVALKLPLLLFLTALGNALAYGLWGRRLGLTLPFAECLRVVLLSFALAALVLAGFAPVLGYFALALQGPTDPRALQAHNLLGLAHVAAVALAGVLAVREQARWLRELDPHARMSGAVVLFWLALNLVLGAQISWNLRPWFGTHYLEVAFLRPHPFAGTFYESVFRMIFHF
ncbi:MAG: hypothetical protein IPJ19_03385 [Planctomycetes bacterium]|nr:hypothetical protein [Planctomycetota bacterium]